MIYKSTTDLINDLEQHGHLIRINPLYSCKSEANCMNVRRAVGSKAVNPDLVIPKFGLLKIAKFVGITYIVKNL